MDEDFFQNLLVIIISDSVNKVQGNPINVV